MHFSRSSVAGVAAAFFFTSVAAQSPLPSGAPTPQEGDVMTHVVQVGDAEGTKKFYPEKINAQPGELVQFQFYPSVCVVWRRI
jgi:plastocyanin